MPEKTLGKLVELGKAGATIVVKGEIAKDVPGLANLEDRRARFKELAGQTTSFHYGDDLDGLLMNANIPRESMSDVGVRFIRRTRDGGYHYFIANHSNHAVDEWVRLAVPAKSAVILDPRFEHRVGVAAVRQADAKTQVRLHLATNESIILRTFTGEQVTGETWRYAQPTGEATAIAGTWAVHFTQGGPTLPQDYETPALASWTTRDDAEAKRFAGSAEYTISFDRPAGETSEYLLDLGKVCETARVTLNGKSLGTLWCGPYQVHVPATMLQARNTLTIEVTNLAANRIADLDRRGVSWKAFHEINFVNRDYKPFDASKWPLRDSGLIGPVTLVAMKEKELP